MRKLTVRQVKCLDQGKRNKWETQESPFIHYLIHSVIWPTNIICHPP